MNEKYTTDTEMMRIWIEEQKGFPALMKKSDASDTQLPEKIVIAFDHTNTALQVLTWEEFVVLVQTHKLALRYDNTKTEQADRFCFKGVRAVIQELNDDSGRIEGSGLFVLLCTMIPNIDKMLF